jgi:hypothetical protein
MHPNDSNYYITITYNLFFNTHIINIIFMLEMYTMLDVDSIYLLEMI